MSAPRPRSRAVSSKIGKPFAQVYMPASYRLWKDDTAGAIRRQWPHDPIEGPVSLEILVCFALPQSKYRKKRPVGRAWHVGKPDIDNVEKAYMDAASGILYLDDKQVSAKKTRCYVGAQDEKPFVQLSTQELGGTVCEIKVCHEIREFGT